jgi:hypothetical protein
MLFKHKKALQKIAGYYHHSDNAPPWFIEDCKSILDDIDDWDENEFYWAWREHNAQYDSDFLEAAVDIARDALKPRRLSRVFKK